MDDDDLVPVLVNAYRSPTTVAYILDGNQLEDIEKCTHIRLEKSDYPRSTPIPSLLRSSNKEPYTLDVIAHFIKEGASNATYIKSARKNHISFIPVQDRDKVKQILEGRTAAQQEAEIAKKGPEFVGLHLEEQDVAFIKQLESRDLMEQYRYLPIIAIRVLFIAFQPKLISCIVAV